MIQLSKVEKCMLAMANDFDFEKMMEYKYIPYAYLCEVCCTILELPCFIDGKCPECNSINKQVLFIRKSQFNGKKEGK